ncbi:putative odorant receptor 83c [Aedes aegypti]|uniref:Odorant receptor n=1 Tax=Aedes aegypti TaxID=7159 RepID=A0A1S4F3I7_AEDAE|nr:odorant receptor 41 [Aedes aegypti]
MKFPKSANVPRGTSSFESFQRILYWQHITLKMIGCDIFEINFRVSFLTVFIIFLAVLFMVISLINLYFFRDNIFNFTFVLVTFFYGVIGCGRLGFLLTHSKVSSKLVFEAKKTYELTSSGASETKVLVKYTKMLQQCVVFFSIAFMLGVVLTAIMPLILFLWNGEKILPFGVILPFTDPNSVDGYQLNYLYQISCMLWTPPGLTASQNMYFALVFNICIQYDLLILKLQALDELICQNKGEIHDIKIRSKIIDIIESQQRLDNFVTTLEELYATQVFIEVGSNALQIVMTLFVQHIDMWMPGYLILLIATFQLFVSCFLGTLIDIKSELFTKAVYDISWHKMGKENQKTLKFMLAKSQCSLQLSCGGMMTLNMNLFLTVYKKIYSIFMMLQNI